MVLAVLFLYGLTLGVATAAPLLNSVNGQGMTMVCTSTGIKFVSESGKLVDGKASMHTLDCSFCMPSGITPSWPPQYVSPPVHVLSYATQSIPSARLAAIVAAPLPPRGPPALHAI
ncbi:MAG: hypothetical protein K2P84_10295 [Undibacterium sp.]|nr:hypothetical protein [Undibacterium sp.]